MFLSQMIWGLGLPSARQVKYTVFPEVTSTSRGSEVILGTSGGERRHRRRGKNGQKGREEANS